MSIIRSLSVKVVDANDQISPAIPERERWLHSPKAAADLQTAMDWCVAHTASDTEVEETLNRLGRD